MIKNIGSLAIVMAFLLAPLSSFGSDSGVKVVEFDTPSFLEKIGIKKDVNPHNGEMCHVCHRASKKTLLKKVSSDKDDAAKRMMWSDLIRLCADCHGFDMSYQHSVDVAVTVNKDNLPLDTGNKINCATTCHNVHSNDPELKKRMIRRSFDDLCLSCHDV